MIRQIIYTSKHRQPFKGVVAYGKWSGFRKLARAMRRGTLTGEQFHVVEQARHSAHRRRSVYRHQRQRRMLD